MAQTWRPSLSSGTWDTPAVCMPCHGMQLGDDKKFAIESKGIKSLSVEELVARLGSPPVPCYCRPDSVAKSWFMDNEFRLQMMFEIAGTLIKGGCTHLYGGFIRDCLVGRLPRDLDIGIKDEKLLKEALRKIEDFARSKSMSKKIIQRTLSFARVRLYVQEFLESDVTFSKSMVSSWSENDFAEDVDAEANYSTPVDDGEKKNLISIDLTIFQSQKAWVDCDINNLVIGVVENDIKLGLRVAHLDSNFVIKHNSNELSIERHSFDVISILSNLEKRIFNLFIPNDSKKSSKSSPQIAEIAQYRI